MTWSALRAEAAKNQFTFAKNAFPQRARSRPGYFVPIDVLNIAAAIADEVVMPHAFRVEARGAAFDGDLTHKTHLHQVPQVVVSCGPRRAGIHAIHGLEDFRSRGMAVALRQECHHGIALRRAAQSTVLQGLFDGFDVHEIVRINLM